MIRQEKVSFYGTHLVLFFKILKKQLIEEILRVEKDQEYLSKSSKLKIKKEEETIITDFKLFCQQTSGNQTNTW